MYISTWPGLNLAAILSSSREKNELPFPLGVRMQTRFFAARYGIYHLFRTLLAQEKGRVLVPAYHHGNEVQAIRATGASITFYSIRANLQPDLDELERLCDGGARVLYVIHYLGWPQPLDELLAFCRRRQLILVEDCALSMLSEVGGRPLGSFGDYSFFCLYKTVPVPNGGVLVQNRNIVPDLHRMNLPPCGSSSVLSRSAELILERLRSRSNVAGQMLFGLKRAVGALSRGFGSRRLPIGNTGFNWDHLNVGASPISNALLRRFDYPEIVRRRRTHYQYLAGQMENRATPVFSSLDEGVCPLFFPVLVRNKRAAAEQLWSRGIGAVEFWNEGDPEARQDQFPEAYFLRKHLLELPIHQDISPRQMEYIAREAKRLDVM